MNDNKVKIFEYLDTLVKMCRSKGNGASLIVEEEEIAEKIKEYDAEIEEINSSISLECYDASAEMADRNIEIITKKLIQQIKSKLKAKKKELEDLKVREEDYSYHTSVLRKNKTSHINYVNSLTARLENSTEDVKDKYATSIQATEEKIVKVNKELESKKLEYVLLQENIEELTAEIRKLEENLKTKESLLQETQTNLKNKESYLDQAKVDKNNAKIQELESKKKRLNDRVKEIHEDSQYLVAKIKEDINADKPARTFEDKITCLVSKAHKIPYMNVDANKMLEEELLKATQERDSFALEIDQKNYSLLETQNPGKIRIDYLCDRIEKWNLEKEELKEKIFQIDNDQKYNYQDKYIRLNELLDTMKKELVEFEKAYANNDEINLTSKSNLKLSIEEKKKEIFEAEDILSLFRKDESIDILHANNLYTVEMKKLDDQIELAQSEINAIKERMISRKSGIIDITSQNRDKDKLKELAVKVIDIKHRRQFAEKPIEIAKELEKMLRIDIVNNLEHIEEKIAADTVEEIKLIVGDSSVKLEDPKVEEQKVEEPVEEKELQPEDFNLEVPPTRGVKVVEQTEIETEETEEIKEEISYSTTIIDDEEDETPESPVEEPVVEEVKEEVTAVEIEEDEDDVITLSNETVAPEVVEEPTPEVIEVKEEIAEVKEEAPQIIDEAPVKNESNELAIGEMFKENSSQGANKHDNIVLENDLSQELDQYLDNLDLPNS